MQRLIVRLIDSHNPEALQAALSWLYSFVRPHRLAIIGLLGLSIFASLLVLVQPWLTKLLIDDGLLGRDFSMVVQIAVLMIFAGITGTALSGVNRYLHTRLSGRILFSLRDDLYRHLQTQSPSFYGERRIGDLMSRLDGDVAEIQRFAVDSLFSAVSSVVGLICAVAMLLTLSWKLSLLVLVLIPLDVLWLRWMRRKVERDVRQLRERSADLSSFMVETLPVMKFIQSAGQQRKELSRLEMLGQGYMSQLLRLQITEFFTQAVPGTLTSLSRACAFLIGGYWVVQGTWQLGALIAFSTYLGMAVGPVQSLLGLYVAIQRMTVSLGRVMELRGEEATVLTPTTPQPMPANGDLRFDAVHFTHPGRRSTLSGIDARIPYGLKVALSGGSGADSYT
ncbi:ABC transporter ATP-binding protein, partial [Pseudomonas sp. CG7]|uniref:ABC transporter transmembrane domain-containing protein n=1 Tax=Pseudomonas sp. CG7 TaxID=191007 RepID=UPI0020336ECA